ncbi:MAG: hypothetical protein IPK18_02555 [Sphingobacteriales bacterium]|nr:MAG: hypothetical protein IPK18_02555 [Sphingobacteriales bacterium]
MAPLTGGLGAPNYIANNIAFGSTIDLSMRGYEEDDVFLGIDGDDATCGDGDGDGNAFDPSTLSGTNTVTSIVPCEFSSNQVTFRECSGDATTERFLTRWQWKWSWNANSITDANSGGAIALSTASDATICAGGNPAVINSTVNPRDPIPSTAVIENIQWQSAQGPLFIWGDIGGAGGLTYDPGVLLTPGTYRFRRKIEFCTGDLLGAAINKEIFSNVIQIDVVADPNPPSASKSPNSASVCLGTNLTLTTPQYGTNPGKSCPFEYQYSTNGGGTWLPAIPQTTIPAITSTGTDNRIRLRVQACTNGCDASAWTQYIWTVISDTAAPTINGDLDVCTGSQTTLTANAPVASTIRWFSDAALTNLVNTGVTYSPTINSDTSFWVNQQIDGCISRATRVNLTALPAPAAPIITADDQSICAGQSTMLNSNVLSTVFYRDDSRTSRLGSGTSVSTGNLAFTTTFYAADTSSASCPGILAAITIDVAPAPDVANVLDETICAGDSILLSGGTATTEWYLDAALTDTLHIGSTYQTTALTTTTKYYLQVPSSCGTAYDSVTVNVNPIPPAPEASDVEVCNGLSSSISLDNTEPGAIVTWYDDAALENAVQVGSVLITPILTEDKTYYVTQTVLGCVSPASSFNVTIIPSSSAPVISADPAAICFGDASTLTSNSEATIWYSDAGQTRIGTGGSIDVMPTNTTTYYAQDTAIGCSALSSVTVKISEILPAPEVENVTVCKGGDVSITGGNSGTVWYSDAGITQVGTGATLTLTNVQATATYYARNEGSTCQSELDDFVVNVTTVATPSASGTTVCSGQSASITATGIANATFLHGIMM